MRLKVLKILWGALRGGLAAQPLPPCGGGLGWGDGSAWLDRRGMGLGAIPTTLPSPARGEGSDWRRRDRSPSGRQLVKCRLDRDLLFDPRRPVLELDRAAGEAARAEDELPGQADEIHGGEFGAGRFVAVVIERLDARIAQFGVQGVGGGDAFGVGRPQIDETDAERRDRFRPDDTLVVVARLDDPADEAREADAVEAHLDGHGLAVRTGDDGIHRVRVFGAGVEEIAGLDAARSYELIRRQR